MISGLMKLIKIKTTSLMKMNGLSLTRDLLLITRKSLSRLSNLTFVWWVGSILL